MNIKQYLFGTLIVLAVLFPYNSAKAGFLDWFNITEGTITVEDPSWSLDSFYALIRTDGVKEQTDSLADASAIYNGAFVKQTTLTSTSAKTVKQKKVLTVEASGYSSTPDQTDDSPFITAKGTYVRDGIIAANMLPFGTLIRIPSVFGDKVFVVEDRMNKRYQNHIDVWFPDRQSALEFGRKTVEIEVI